jgi:hypothetical protein
MKFVNIKNKAAAFNEADENKEKLMGNFNLLIND